MTQQEFEGLLGSIKTLSPEQIQRLRMELDNPSAAPSPGQAAAVGGEESREELQRRLFEAGVLSEIKPPITDLAPYRNRKAIPIQGGPLSETVIRERR